MRTVAMQVTVVGFLALLGTSQLQGQGMSKPDNSSMGKDHSSMSMGKQDGMAMGKQDGMAMTKPGSMATQHGKVLQNVDGKGVALQGFDPVSFFDTTPVKGKAEYSSQYDGATYLFASAAHKSNFDQDPAHYAPQFGGYCAYAASKGQTASIEVDAYQVVDGRLLMQHNKSVRDLFNKDSAGNLKQADQNWPGIVDREGKPATH